MDEKLVRTANSVVDAVYSNCRPSYLIFIPILVEFVVVLIAIFIHNNALQHGGSDALQGFGFFYELIVKPVVIVSSIIIAYSYFRTRTTGSLPLCRFMRACQVFFGIIPVFIILCMVMFGMWHDVKYRDVAITNIHDELFLSPQGNPIGIRLTYTARFPLTDNFFIRHRLDAVSLQMSSYSSPYSLGEYGAPHIVPNPESGTYFSRGREYDITVTLIPEVFMYTTPTFTSQDEWVWPGSGHYSADNPPVDEHTKRCIDAEFYFAEAQAESINTANPKPFYMLISVQGVKPVYTQTTGLYTVRMFIDGARADGILPCPENISK